VEKESDRWIRIARQPRRIEIVSNQRMMNRQINAGIGRSSSAFRGRIESADRNRPPAERITPDPKKQTTPRHAARLDSGAGGWFYGSRGR
jgi:hypothetical protein